MSKSQSSATSVPDLETPLETVKGRMERAAEEAIKEIFARFPFGQQVTLFTGKAATLKVFFEPKQVEGRWQFGVDMQYDDGSGHLEYIVKQTGWGGAP